MSGPGKGGHPPHSASTCQKVIGNGRERVSQRCCRAYTGYAYVCLAHSPFSGPRSMCVSSTHPRESRRQWREGNPCPKAFAKVLTLPRGNQEVQAAGALLLPGFSCRQMRNMVSAAKPASGTRARATGKDGGHGGRL